MSAPRSARWLPALVTRLGRPSRPFTLDAARALAAPPAVRRILAVKTHDQLGDFLVAMPAVAALRARYPAARLDLVTRDYLAPLAVRQPAIDRVHVLPRALGPGAPGAGPRALWNVARPRPDLVVVLNSVSRSRTADLVAALAGGRLVVGRSVVGAGPLPAEAPTTAAEAARAGTDPVYDVDLPVARASDHQVERLLDLVRWLGADADGADRAPVVVLTAADRERGAAVLAGAAAAPPGEGVRRIGIHPAAANALKCWPVESWATWGEMLAARAGEIGAKLRLVVLDTPKEPGPARALVAALAARGVAAGFVPALPLGAFAGACAGLDLLACNDSGVMHVAAAVGVPVLSFHSLGRPAEWAPRNEAAIALHGEPIAAIGVETAVAAALRLLGA